MKLEIVVCNTMLTRFLGFMGKKKIDKILCFPKCNSVHTFFMKCNIDIYMTDKEKNIKFVFRNVGKNRIIWPKPGIYYTYEVPTNYKLTKKDLK